MFQVQIPLPCLSPAFIYLGHIFWRKYFSKKNALTELYYNLSYETLSGGRDLKFDAISDLTADMSFQMKRSTFLNLKRKNEQDKKVTLTLKILMISFKSQGTMKNLKMN